MIHAIILTILSVAAAFGVWALCKKCGDKQIPFPKRKISLSALLKRILGVLLFCLYMPHLFEKEVIYEQVGLQGDLFPAAVYVLLAVLDWLTVLTIALAIFSPFYEKKEAKDYLAFIATPILLLNAVFIQPITISILGSADMLHWRTFVYEGIVLVATAICGSSMLDTLFKKDFANLKQRLGKTARFAGLSLIAFMPIYFLQLLFGFFGGETKGFSFVHRMYIYASFLIPAVIFIVQHKKDKEENWFLMTLLSFSGLVAYCSLQPFRTGSAVFPLHLCNTAIFMMFIAYAFRLRGIYYFTFFVNVIGSLVAILISSAPQEVSSMHNVTYWYNHLYAFFLPLLGIGLELFPRPKLKMICIPIVIFTVYILTAMTLNTYLNSSKFGGFNGKYSANFFFLHDDFLLNKFPFAIDLKYDFVWKFTVAGNTMEAYPVYSAAIYIGFLILMFVMWGFYMLMFHISDSHKQLAHRRKLQRVDRLNLLKELNGRPLSEPLNKEGVHMIKIKNFSKTYAGTNKKAVDDLCLEIHDGEVFGFIGHNGAGKSTTIKSLVGIQSITEGSIEIEGYDIARQPLEAKLRLGYVSDNHALYEKLTGREYINYVAELYMVSKEDKEARINKFVKMFQLEHAIDNEIKSYSHGMKQKTMVIAALIHNPKVWVLDEPLTGLDPTSAWQIKECMREHANAGNIVFFSSHVIEVVERICDRIAIISGGKLRRVNTIEEIKAEGISLEQLYLQYAQKKNDSEPQKKPAESQETPNESKENAETPAESQAEIATTQAEPAPTENTPVENAEASAEAQGEPAPAEEKEEAPSESSEQNTEATEDKAV